ncbi:MarR family winged helix-turn-helix transcriptional regulator [Priestia aryabhattai]|uniref:MarR family winged helix-turn-helix transcriptional regulator n=1 Tax=Priestia aryabhattai TaxID=412384 RepID=UPI00064F100D|nr:MarR family winged helix-turn-helix transcriptional regulator [Priestia aryabhattai]KML26985.1 MarR family transcriptional regulator [Priestia aryabhattai]KMN98986.1 MarR family transcriptional regulator [Priestia aryabhattai]MED3952198.1 MarR family winged helix-turn-helix transcriptional regulator [Priestia aryabhattai]MED4393216.1 MarR family winged helix-turn-helix transcriptional regulator [Priestia aryabhattai]
MDVTKINDSLTDIYFYLHYKHEETLTHQNIRCMQMIKKKKEVTVKDLSEVLDVTHHTASEHIKRLINKGILEKERSAYDKRVVYVKLTPYGEEVLKRNTELDEEKLKMILERLSLEEQQKIINAFSVLREEIKHVYST